MDVGTGVTAEVLLAHAGWMRTLARHLVHDPSRADDVVQQSWLAAIERPPRHGSNLPAWLRRVVTNSARQMRRGESRRSARELALARDEALPPTDALVEQMELQRTLASAILQLSEPYRSTILLRFYRDLAPREIAALQGEPAATVRSRIRRALEQLRTELDGHCGGDSRAWCALLQPLLRAPAALSVGVKSLAALTAVALAALATWWIVRPAAPAPSGSPDLVVSREPLEGLREDAVATPLTPSASVETTAARAPVAAGGGAVGTSYSGTVSDPDGNAIVGASLRIFPKDGGNWRDAEPLASGVSDGAGHFDIPVPTGLDTQRYLLIEARAEGHQTISLDPVTPEQPISISLNWTAVVHGKVIDAETRRPVPGVWLSSWTAETTSDAAGAFRLPDTPVAQRIHLRAHKEGYAVVDEYVTFDSREPEPYTLELRPGVPMRLHVFDDDTQAPLAGAQVLHGYENTVGTTDGDGELVLWIANGTEVGIEVRKEGYATFSWHLEVKDTRLLQHPRIAMLGLGWIDGVARDERGDPLAGCHFYAPNSEEPSNRRRLDSERQLELGVHGYGSYEVGSQSAPSDEQGRFSIAVIPSPHPFRITGGSREHVAPDVAPIHVAEAGQRAWVEVVQVAGATVRGHVRYNGEGLGWLSVFYEHENGSTGGFARTASDGRFEMKNVRAGRVQLKVRGTERHSPLTPEPVELVVVAGREYEREIAWSEELVSIDGFVREHDGQPVVGETVGALCQTAGRGGVGASFHAETGPDGSFSIGVARGHAYTVSVRRAAARARREDVAAGSRDVELVLPEVGQVCFRLVDAATGTDVAVSKSHLWGLSWRATGTDAFTQVRRPERRDGVVRLDVPVGATGTIDLNVSLSEDGYAPRRLGDLPIHRGPGTPPVTRIELEHGIDCTLALVGDEPLTAERRAGHLFFLLHEEQLPSVRGPYPRQGGPSNHRINGVNMWVAEPSLLYQMPHFDETGLAYMRGLAPGRYSLEVFPKSYAFEPATFELTTDGAVVEIGWR